MDLKQWALAGVLIATVMVGLTGFISEGVSLYNVSDKVDQGELDKLEQIENSTSIARDAQRRAESINTRPDFSTLPGVIQILKLPFESIPVIGLFLSTLMDLTGVSAAHGGWPFTLAMAFVTVTIAFLIARRLR